MPPRERAPDPVGAADPGGHRSAPSRRLAWLAAAVLLLAGAPPATAQEGGQQGQEAADAAVESVAAADAPELDNVINMVVARVDGDPILWTDLLEEERDLLPLLQQRLTEAELAARMDTLRKGFLRGLIEERMIQNRAEELGLTADPNQIDRAIQRLRQEQGLGSEEQFRQALEASGLTVADVREQLRRQIIRSQLIYEEVQRGLFVSDTEIQRYYEEHQEEFVTPSRVRLQQLVFLTEGRDPTAVREQAANAVAELRDGRSPEEVAGRYEGAALPGGADSFVQVDELNDALAAAVPELEVGAYSEPVQSQFGFHIIQVLERQDQQVASLEEAREQIRNRVQQEKQQERMDRYLEQLHDRTHIQILHPAFKVIEEEWEQERLRPREIVGER